METGIASAAAALPIVLRWFTNSNCFLFANKRGKFLKIRVGILPLAASKSCLILKAAFLLFCRKATHPFMFLNDRYMFFVVEVLKKLSSSLIEKTYVFRFVLLLIVYYVKNYSIMNL